MRERCRDGGGEQYTRQKDRCLPSANVCVRLLYSRAFESAHRLSTNAIRYIFKRYIPAKQYLLVVRLLALSFSFYVESRDVQSNNRKMQKTNK